jgi:exonuclease SbcC
VKLKSLRLVNFKGLLAGVGLPEVFIDFEQLPEGLIAVVGGNGMGKTTILDNLHPYRLMPYKLRKADGWSPAAFSYYDQCSGDARKELVFELGGVTYKSLILIDAARRKQEPYLYRMEADWVPLNDGKTKTYDEAVEKVCGSPSLFFTSVFRSQGARNLSDYSRGDIMAIVAELLNIDHIREQGKKCKEVADSLLLDRDEISRKANDLTLALESEPDAFALMDDLLEKRKGADMRLGMLGTQIAENEEALRKAEADVSAQDAERRRLEDKKKALADMRLQADGARAEFNATANNLTAEMARLRSRRDEAVVRLQEDHAAVGCEVRELNSRADGRLEEISAKLGRFEKIQSGADQIRAAVKNEDGLTKEISERKRLLMEARATLDRQQKAHFSAKELSSNADSTRRNLDMLENQAAGMADLDCRADGTGWVNETCPLLAGAVHAKKQSEMVRTTLARIEADLKPLAADLDPRAITVCEEVVQAREKALAEDEAAMADAQRFTRLLPELEQAEEQLAALSEERVRLERERDDDMKRLNSRAADLLGRINVEKGSADEQLAEKDAALAKVRFDSDARMVYFDGMIRSLQGEISSLELALLHDPTLEVSRLRSLIETFRRESDGLVRELTDVAGQIGAVQSRLDVFGKLRAQLEELEKSLEGYDANIADWRLLQKACGNDGVIALELDDSGPSISAIANDLLRTCYGPRFSIRFETQAEKNGGGTKEVFDIMVYDSEADEVVSITEKSGGQTCWLEDAVTRAICLYNIHRSDRVFGTLFSDEKDGALDADRKQEFMAVKRRSLELGTHTRELFISQTPELIDLADGMIRLSPGHVEVV